MLFLNYLTKLPFSKLLIHKISEAARGKCIVYFSLHRLLNRNNSHNHPDYLNKTALTPEEFLKLAKKISKTLKFISMNESISLLTGQSLLKKSSAVLIIEVAYQETLEILEPIITELNIPVTLMLTCNNSEPWADEVMRRFFTTGQTQVVCSFFDRTFELNTSTDRISAATHVINNLAHSNPQAFKQRLNMLRELVPDSGSINHCDKIASHKQIKKFLKNPQVSYSPCEVESSGLLKKLFGKNFAPIFYYHRHFDKKHHQSLHNLIIEAGLVGAISNHHGVCRPGDNMFRLNRLPMNITDNSFERFELQGLSNAIDEFLLVSTAQEEKY